MRRVIVSEFVSLDGVIEDPGGAEGFERGGWTFQFDRGPEGDEFKFDELAAVRCAKFSGAAAIVTVLGMPAHNLEKLGADPKGRIERQIRILRNETDTRAAVVARHRRLIERQKVGAVK